MLEKPTTASGYPPDQVARVKATCLYLATKLGDIMDELVVVGGLVPSLLVDQAHLSANVTPHVGTLDLDLGLAFALVGEQRYQEVTDRLTQAGFETDVNDEGIPTRQRWRISDPPVTVDFLIEPESKNAKAGMSVLKDSMLGQVLMGSSCRNAVLGAIAKRKSKAKGSPARQMRRKRLAAVGFGSRRRVRL